MHEKSLIDISVSVFQNLSSIVLLALLRLKVVVRTNFLHQSVISACEGDEDANNLKGFGADPGCLGLGVFRVAGLPRVVHAGLGLLRPVGSLVFDPAVKFSQHHDVMLLLLLVQRGGAGGLRGTELRCQMWNQD